MMRYLSVCSGIEAASVAWEPLGWTAAGYSEIEPFSRAVLQHRLGAVPCDWDHRWQPGQNYAPLFGDFTQIEAHHVGPIDLLIGGTPCQSFSIAGKRLGLDDPRGNLTLDFLALARRVRPRWICWENVPGVLSDDGGRTMGTFLGIVGQLGYTGGYRVLDAQFVRVDGFGRAVPQRRRRVFFVGHLGNDARAAAVLFDRESLRGDSAPRREAGKGIAPTISARTKGGGGLGTDFDCDGGLIAAEVAPTLNAHFGDKQGLENQHIDGGGDCSLPHVSMCLNAGAMGRRDAETETLIPITGAVFDVAHSLSADGLDASEDGTGRGTPLVPVCFDETQITSAANYSNPAPGDPCHPLAAGARPPTIAFPTELSGTQCASTKDLSHALSVKHTMAIAFSSKDYGNDAMDDLSPTLRSMGHDANHANIRAASGGSSRSYVGETWAVRRLTPRECEKLQGFPPDWTLIPWRKGHAADGPRYKAIGNSMACNVMRWLGMRIAWADSLNGDDT